MEKKVPSFKQSLLIVSSCFFIIIIGILFFHLKAEVLLCISAMVMALGAWRLGYSWIELENAISERIGKTTPVLLLLWSIGMVIGTFMFSGSIPMIIYYGLKLIRPSFLVVSAYFTCIIFSVITGSSWSSAGTVGVAFAGMAQSLGVPLPITIGAIISGSMIGDKMSPLSETTNLAPLCAGSNLYDHIQSMLWTTIPPAIIAAIVYFVVGINLDIVKSNIIPQQTIEMMTSINGMYHWSILLLLPFIIIIIGSLTKKPPVPTIFIASLSAILIGVFFQGFSISDGFKSAVNGFNVSMIFKGIVSSEVSIILNRGGMVSMVNVILIVFCGYTFASITSKAKFLEVVLNPILRKVKNQTALILATLFTMLLMMLSTGSAYIGFILVPEMFKEKYKELKVAPRVLSRSLEDIGTLTGVLIPWGVSAIFYTSTFGSPIYGVGGFGIWTIIAYLSPLFAITYAITGIGVQKLTD